MSPSAVWALTVVDMEDSGAIERNRKCLSGERIIETPFGRLNML
ncbi:hypothetical protein BMAPRL20_0999 [Burkholderia mallei PRL-20]|nr:hypothetical protein BMA10247_A1409 [Burkholderia mallei NCTC 10247]EEP49503.1 conserved hypothetical protein [Burkholderia pseudomallei MSHR346]EES46584.1 hypothetical protein BMAPRL20_0999 [Burkholderia mallei PRL-20]